MIHEIKHADEPNTYLISAYQVWRPGSFATRADAVRGQRLTDEAINELRAKFGETPIRIVT